jgi:hypothetical protein
VLLASGAAFSGNNVTAQAQVRDFDPLLLQLWADVKNEGLQVFQSDPGTRFLPALINPNQWPPSPCRWIAIVWDATIFIDQLIHQTSVGVFRVLMEAQGQNNCNVTVTHATVTHATVAHAAVTHATVTNTSSGKQLELLSIAPSP